MAEDKPRDLAAVRAEWDERAQRYDAYYETFKGAVEHLSLIHISEPTRPY